MFRRVVVAGAALTGLSATLFGCGGSSDDTTQAPSPTPPPGPTPPPLTTKDPVYHFEAFAFKNGVDAAAVRAKFFKLKTCCKKEDNEVIAELSGGDQSSPEKISQGYTQGYVLKFNDGAARDFYLGARTGRPDQDTCQCSTEFRTYISDKITETKVKNTKEYYHPGVMVFDFQGVAGGSLATDKWVHNVFFRFNETASHEETQNIQNKFLALKNQCNFPGAEVTVESLVAGNQVSAEMVTQNFEQGYVMVFPNETYLEWYLGCLDKPCQDGGTKPAVGYCVAHDNFKKEVGPLLLNKDDFTGAPDLSKIDTAEAFRYHPGQFVTDFVI